MRFILVALIALLVGFASAEAQTDTPPPPTATIPPTPNVLQVWTMVPPESTGTPQPGQDVAFAYEMNAGDVAILIVIAALLISFWAAFLFWYLIDKRDED